MVAPGIGAGAAFVGGTLDSMAVWGSGRGRVKGWHCGVSVLGAFRSHRAGSVDGRPLLPPSGQTPFPRLGLRRPGRGACTGWPPLVSQIVEGRGGFHLDRQGHPACRWSSGPVAVHLAFGVACRRSGSAGRVTLSAARCSRMSGRVPAGWTRLPFAGIASRQMETCSTMWAHGLRKPHIQRLSSALPTILESKGEDLTTAAQDLSRGRQHGGII